MDTKPIKFRRAEGRKPVVSQEEDDSLAIEGLRIREADERDGTNEFLEASFDDAVAGERD